MTAVSFLSYAKSHNLLCTVNFQQSKLEKQGASAEESTVSYFISSLTLIKMTSSLKSGSAGASHSESVVYYPCGTILNLLKFRQQGLTTISPDDFTII